MALTLNQAERRELITALVTNCAGWDEDDISLLANMSPAKLWTHAQGCAQMIANAEAEDDSGLPDSLEPHSVGEMEDEAEDDGWEEENLETGDDDEDGPEAGTDHTQRLDQPKRCHDDNGNEIDCPDSETTATGDNVQNEYSYLSSLPPRVRSVVLNAMKFEHAQKQQLVGQITANSRNRFSDSYLMRMGVEELQALSELATPARRAQPTYIGAAGGPTFNESHGVDRDDILVPPVLEFKRG